MEEKQYTGADSRFLAAVADGMGGEESGETASLFTVEALIPCGLDEIRETALAGIRHANDRICREMEETVGKGWDRPWPPFILTGERQSASM